MVRKTLAVLGIGAVVAGFASVAQAQSAMPSGSSDSSTTLSGDSLRTVESRTLSGDYRTFFRGTVPVAEGAVDGNATDDSKSPEGFQLENGLEVVVGDTLDSRESLNVFTNPGEPGDRQRVKVQLQLGGQ